MPDSVPGPPLSAKIFAAVKLRGPLTFTQIVHATRANRGSVWRLLKRLQASGHLGTITQHGRIHYVVLREGKTMDQ